MKLRHVKQNFGFVFAYLKCEQALAVVSAEFTPISPHHPLSNVYNGSAIIITRMDVKIKSEE